MTITYTIAIDYNENGDFIESGDNITEHVLRAEWHLGMSAPYATVSEIATAKISVLNANRDFSPEVNGNLIDALMCSEIG